MRIGVAATPDVAIPTLDWLLQSEHTIELVITQPDRPAGRGRELKQSVVADWATSHQIPVLKPETSQDLIGHIEELDLVLTIGYGVLLPVNILTLPKYGFLNLHFSLLPAYRGAAPAQRALQNGDTTTGVTIFQLEKGMDTGPIFAQEELSIDPEWRSFELLQKLAAIGPKVVQQSFQMITCGQSPIAQRGTPSIASKISKAEAQINFNQDSRTIINSVRAFTFEPGAWTTWKGEPFKISSVKIASVDPSSIGLISIIEGHVFVGTKDGAIELLRVTPPGKREMDAIEWARGARLSGGENFG